MNVNGNLIGWKNVILSACNKMLWKRAWESIHFTVPEGLGIVIFVTAAMFLSSLWMQRTEYTAEPDVFLTYWGFPLEALKVNNAVTVSYYIDIGTMVVVQRTYELLWGGMIGNVVAYAAVCIATMKLTSWIRSEMRFRRYYESWSVATP